MKTCAFLLTIVIGGGIAVGGDAKDDLAKLKGTWVHEGDGKKHELKFDKDSFIMTFSSSDKKGHAKGTIKIDANNAMNTQADLTLFNADNIDQFNF